MANIIVLSELAKEIVEKLDESNGELTPEILEMYQTMVNRGMAAIAPLCDVKDELTARMKARKEKGKELIALAKRDEEMIETAKKTIVKIMTALGQDKFSNGALTVTLAKGRDKVVVSDEESVPMSCKVATVKVDADQLEAIQLLCGDHIRSISADVDKAKIKHLHDSGVGVEGTVIEKDPYLLIKG